MAFAVAVAVGVGVADAVADIELGPPNDSSAVKAKN